MRRILTVILLILSLTSVAQAQVTTGGDNTTTSDSAKEPRRLSARDLCSNYRVDARILDSASVVNMILDSLQRVDPTPYPIMSQWCRQQMRAVRMMRTSLQNDYTIEGDMIWIDSSICIFDAGDYLMRLERMETELQTRQENYDKLEQERIEAERKAAEERARAEALRIQKEKDQRLTDLKDTLRTLHKEISSVCDAKGVTDKARIKELKDIFYAYLSVYNRYDLTNNNTDNSHFKQLEELQKFQCELIDSILGPNSYSNRIESFKNTLHLRSGKDHTDVNKSYLRVFKKVQIPIGFKTIAEYNEYVGQLKEVLEVQQGYITVIEIRETLAKNTLSLQQKCQKRHREVFNSYNEIYGELNTVPAFTSLAESRTFINKLEDFLLLQQEYSVVIDRLDNIQQRGDSIVGICPKELSDVANAYKELVNGTNFIPQFINKASADHFNKSLDDFIELQQLYIQVIDIRKEIEKGSLRVTSSKNAPKGLIAGYKQMMKYTDFTPHFSNIEAGEDFIKLLNHFIDIQNKFIKIVDDNNIIDNNGKQFRSAFKLYPNIYKAYERLLKTYDYELNILSEADINSYMRHQESILAMQEQFKIVANSLEKEDYNNRLKKVKETDKIKLIMGIK